MRGLWGTSALAAALTAGAVMGSAEAQTQTDVRQYAETSTDTDEYVTVTATRTPQDTYSVPSVVTVIDADQIEENLVTDIKDLIRFEPGVSVPTSPSRFSAAFSSVGRDGNSGFNIRGLGGDRVLLQIDGVRIPDGFTFGPAAFGRGDYVDLDLLQSVEILRGPGSALYGSDGLAGVVSFITKDPADFLNGDERYAARARAAYASADDSLASGPSAAGRWGDWSGIVAYTHRDGHEQETHGDNDVEGAARTTANPQDIVSDAAMARLVFQPSDAHRFRFTVDYGQRDVSTEALTASTATVLAVDGVDSSERRRVGLDYTYENEGGLIDRGFAAIYQQMSEAEEFSAEDRDPAADRTRITTLDNDVWGASLQLVSEFATGAAVHRLVYGGDYSQTHQEGLRDGLVPPFGEIFPTRPFPNTDYGVAGIFIQDQISFMDGRVSFFPAVRYDSYDLDPEADSLYVLPVAGQSDSRVTPRFGVVVWPSEHFGVFFNYAEGFRAPAPSQVNNAFTNLASGYTSIPNPDLKPETSESAELGVRWRDVDVGGATLRATASVFTANYDDFIEQVMFGDFGDPAVFQFVNLGAVEIRGAEARADLDWENGFGLTLAASFAEGDEIDPVTGRTPLDSIDPFKLVAGLTYNDPDGRFGGQFILTHSQQKAEDRVADPTAFRPDGFSILDLTGYWNVTDAATVRVGLFNVTDEKYWWWSDARGVSAASTTLDAYTQPGRNFSASISYRF